MDLKENRYWKPVFEGFQLNKSLLKSNYNPNIEMEFTVRPNWFMINEDTAYVPRFNISRRFNKLFAEFPVNKELKYSDNLMKKAIEFGMIILIQYRGAEDEFVPGHSRVIYPMVLGSSSKGKQLLRGYHFKGWSVSKRANIEKEWRMFRTDRILSMSFTGNFYRLAPQGYNMFDKGMKGGVIIAADLYRVRQNQEKLLKAEDIQDRDEVEFERTDAIEVTDTETVIDLNEPFENVNIENDNLNHLRLSFLRSVDGKEWISVMGALGKPGERVRVYSNGKYKGMFNILRSFMGTLLDKPAAKRIQGRSEFDLYIYVKKI